MDFFRVIPLFPACRTSKVSSLPFVQFLLAIKHVTQSPRLEMKPTVLVGNLGSEFQLETTVCTLSLCLLSDLQSQTSNMGLYEPKHIRKRVSSLVIMTPYPTTFLGRLLFGAREAAELRM